MRMPTRQLTMQRDCRGGPDWEDKQRAERRGEGLPRTFANRRRQKQRQRGQQQEGESDPKQPGFASALAAVGFNRDSVQEAGPVCAALQARRGRGM